MGKTPDELTPHEPSSIHDRKPYAIPFSTGTGQHLGNVDWLPHEGEQKVMSTPTPIEATDNHERFRDRGYDRSDSDGDDNDGHDDIAEIEQEIEHTRAELSETIDSIQARLAPDQLVEHAKEAAWEASSNLVEESKAALFEATLGRADQFLGKAEQIVSEVNDTARGAGDSFLTTIRQNPLPGAMAGIGLWMLFSKRKSSHTNGNGDRYTSRRWRYDDEYPAAGHYQPTLQNDLGMSGGMSTGLTTGMSRAGESHERTEFLGDARDTIKDTVGGIASSVGDLASGATDRAGHLATSTGSTAKDAGETMWEMIRRNPMPAAVTGIGLAWMLMNRDETRFRPVHTVSEKMPDMSAVGDIADSAKDRIGDFGSGAQMQAHNAKSQLSGMLQDTPLAFGAAALSLGVALGLAIPETSRERQLMGPARESLMEKGQQAAHEAQERFMQAAERVQETAKQELSEVTNEHNSQQRPDSAGSSWQSGQSGTSSPWQAGHDGSSAPGPQSRAS